MRICSIFEDSPGHEEVSYGCPEKLRNFWNSDMGLDSPQYLCYVRVSYIHQRFLVAYHLKSSFGLSGRWEGDVWQA